MLDSNTSNVLEQLLTRRHVLFILRIQFWLKGVNGKAIYETLKSSYLGSKRIAHKQTINCVWD